MPSAPPSPWPLTEGPAHESHPRSWRRLAAWWWVGCLVAALGAVLGLALRHQSRLRPVIALLEQMSTGSRAERAEARQVLLRDPESHSQLLVRIVRRGKTRWHTDILPWLDSIPWLARQRSHQQLLERNAIDALQRMGPRAAPAVVPLLADARLGGRDTAIPLLRTYGAAALPVIIGVLDHPDEASRAGAALTLARFPAAAEPVLPALQRARRDLAPTVRVAALWGLGQMLDRPTEIVPALVDALADADPGVQLQAIQSLRFFRQEAAPAVTALRRLLRESPPDHRAEAALALAAIGDSAKAAADELLGNVRGTEARPARQAAATLVELGIHREEAFAKLRSQLEDEDGRQRIRTAQVLGGLGPKAQPLIPNLLALLENADLQDDRPTVQALRFIDPAAIPERFRTRRNTERDRPNSGDTPHAGAPEGTNAPVLLRDSR